MEALHKIASPSKHDVPARAVPGSDSSFPAFTRHGPLKGYEADTTDDPSEANTALSPDAVRKDQPPDLPEQRPEDTPATGGGKDHQPASDTRGEPTHDHAADNTHWSDSSSSSSESSDDEPAETQKPKKRVTFGLKKSPTKTKKKQEATSNMPERTNSAMGPKGFDFNNSQVRARGKVSKRDGRLKISLTQSMKGGPIGEMLSGTLRHHVATGGDEEEMKENIGEGWERARMFEAHNWSMTPKMNIVIMVIGSRGDIQPFIKIGQILKDQHGHRVRIATHPAFRAFVEEDCGLEFFSVGGNPSELMAFMVKNPGLIPSMETVKKGEITRRRNQMAEMFEGFWRACIKPSDDLPGRQQDPKLEPFIADAIIANPPSFAHVHCAERLGCPLHIMFTFPYTPTTQFPHPLANIKPGNMDQAYTNFMSYPLVDMMTWQGLGDLVNDFRTKTLGLDPVSKIWAPSQLYRLHVPYTYCWSPSLVPKPEDWGKEIDIAGYVFLDLASSYEPPDDLKKFLDNGDPPIYIGFGSIVIDDPDRFTQLIFEAVDKAGVRALVNKGWGGIGSDKTPDNIFMLENTPHDWLFPKCKAVVHHGGAGTAAIGLKCGKPTMVVPFFGDQPFWGAMISKAKAGAFECIPYKELTVDKFAEGIKQCLTDEAQENVQKIADSIAKEGDGAENAVKSFHAHLPWRGSNSMYCSVLPDRAANWRPKGSKLKLSPLAAELLVKDKKLDYKDLRLLRHYEWNDFQGPGAPITGTASGLVHSLTNIGEGLAEGPVSIGKDIHKHRKYKQKREGKSSHRLSWGHRKKHSDSSATDDSSTSSEKTAEKKEDKEKDSQQEKTESHQKRDRGHPTANALPENTQQSGQVKSELNKESSSDPSSIDHRTPASSHQTDGEDTADTASIASDASSHLGENIAKDAGRGIIAPLAAVAELPMNILLGLGQGLHNAPRLYGDTTVRRPRRVTGFNSGLHAALEEFVLGTYDAFSGVVTQPYKGARDDGVLGGVKGVGKGIGGLVLKESAAVIAPLGLAMKGVQKEVNKAGWIGGHAPLHEIRDARYRQGAVELAGLSAEQREKVVKEIREGWDVMATLWSRQEAMKKEGLEGRVRLEQVKRIWERYGVFESVALCKEALAAMDEGKDLESTLREARRRKIVEGEEGEEDGKHVTGVSDVAREEERMKRQIEGKGEGEGKWKGDTEGPAGPRDVRS